MPRVISSDGLPIVYSVAGAGDTTLVFIHGGTADRTFFDGQLALSDRYRIIAIDLAGHGESGMGRDPWTIERAGEDVARVVDAEQLKRVILFGNSLGGLVAIEAALRLGDRVLGVVGIDTFHGIGNPDHARLAAEELQRRDELAADYEGTLRTLVKMLFHPDADPALVRDIERRVLRTPRETTLNISVAMAGYDPTPSARKLTVPLRAINGDLFPFDVVQIRAVKPDFDAVLMKHVGHYLMLERPTEFNDAVLRVIASFPPAPSTAATPP